MSYTSAPSTKMIMSVEQYGLPPPYAAATNGHAYQQRLAQLQQEYYQLSMQAQQQQSYQHQQQQQQQQKEQQGQLVVHRGFPAQQHLPIAHRDKQPSSSSTTPLPVVVPQTSGKLFRNMSPFMRAYAPQLQQHGISQSTFLTFIDGLNEAFMASPALQCVQLAGTVCSFAPSGIAQAVGGGLSLAAGVGGAASSIARTKSFIKKANASIFAPRGLSVKIVSTNDMMALLGGGGGGEGLPPLPEFSQQIRADSPDPRVRRMQALRGRVAELDTNVPAMQMPDSVLRKMGAWQAKRQDEKERKEYAKQSRKDAKMGADAAKREQREQKSNQRIRWIVIVPAAAAAAAAAQNNDEHVDIGLS